LKSLSSFTRCLVTGGAGFIGSHLVERLLADGHMVTVLDNFSTGRMENLQAVRGNPCFSIQRVDVATEDINPFFEGVDWVFHLAALADIVPSIQHPLEYHRANVNGTVAVLEAARLADVKRLVYAASSSCYGIPDEYPTPETAPTRPMYPYALTKYLGEQILCIGGRFTGYLWSRCASSMSMVREHAPPAPMARCSACSWRKNWPRDPSRW